MSQYYSRSLPCALHNLKMRMILIGMLNVIKTSMIKQFIT